MDKKFIIWPGHVTSKTDGQTHYISARALIDLWGVNPKECIIVNPHRPETMRGLPLLPVLGPRISGNYKLNRASAVEDKLSGKLNRASAVEGKLSDFKFFTASMEMIAEMRSLLCTPTSPDRPDLGE